MREQPRHGIRVIRRIRHFRLRHGTALTLTERRMRLEKRQPMRGVYTICMEMCMSGAGTGMDHIAAQKPIRRVFLPGFSARTAAEAGGVRPRTVIRQTGLVTVHRATGAAALAFVLQGFKYIFNGFYCHLIFYLLFSWYYE